MSTHVTLPLADTESVWAETEMPGSRKLTQNVDADVCIVGGGIAGLTTGYLLAKAGKSVVILDDGPLAGGMTQVTTAHLSDAIDDRFTEIEKWHGERGAFLAAESHTAAINRIESIAGEQRVRALAPLARIGHAAQRPGVASQQALGRHDVRIYRVANAS